MRVLLTGGGTAGHINPAIAIANYIRGKEKDSEFLFVGTQHGLEKKLVPKCGYDIKFIEVMGLKRSLSPQNIKVFINYIKSIRESRRIIKEFKPDVVIGTGGYVCAPVVNSAASLKIPTLIHEQNVFPGLAIKMLSQKADITAISFDETRNMMKAKKMVLTGNPLRPDLFTPHDKDVLRANCNFDEKPIVLMFGGSLGAEKMNAALIDMVKNGRIDGFNLIAVTGERHYEEVARTLSKEGVNMEKQKNVKILPYIYNMEEVFGVCDMIVGRAGAITVSEITALGKAAVLIPSPYVAHNHQEYNARYLEKNGAAKVVLESELSGQRLAEEIGTVLKNTDKLKKMQQCSKKIGITDACETIYNCIREII
mgnify:CR=1 FL=1